MRLKENWNVFVASFVAQSVRTLFNSLHVFCDSFQSTVPVSPATDKKPQNVLIIRLDAIGDFFVWIDAAQTLRDLYPSHTHRLVLVANQAWAELAESLQVFDEIIPVSRDKFKKKLPYRRKILSLVRSRYYDLVLHPTYARDIIFGDSVVRMALSDKKIGFKGDENPIEMKFWQKIGKRWYTQLITPDKPLPTEFSKNEYFIQQIGKPDYKIEIGQFPATRRVESDLPQKYFVLFPGARVGKRQWPVENFAQLASFIYEKTGWSCVICGSADEADIAEVIKQNSKAPTINLAGKTKVKDLPSIIQAATLLIGNETSGIHIAASVKTPSICILGGGHFGKFVPYPFSREYKPFVPVPVYHQMECFGCNWRCKYTYAYHDAVPCVSSISFESVWAETERLIDKLQHNNVPA